MVTGTNNSEQRDANSRETVNREVDKAANAAHKAVNDTANKVNQTTQKAANKANQAIDSAAQTAAEAPEVISGAIDSASDKAKEAVDRASDGLKQTANTAATQIQQAQHDLVNQANTIKANAAQSLYQAAQKIRSDVRSGEGQPVAQAEEIAARLDGMGRYLEANSFEEIESDARRTIQKNPWQSVGVAAVVGFFLARLFGGNRR